MAQGSTRRTFVKSMAAAAMAAAPAVAYQGRGANDRLNLGVIGLGNRGYYLGRHLYAANIRNARIGYVCDIFDGHLARAEELVASREGSAPKTTKDYRDVLADDTIDAVFIATPERHHFRMTMDAIAAGKHIYVEKPLAHTIEEGEQILAAAARSDSVIQVGTQNRSNSLYRMAKDLVEQGMIGDLHCVRAFCYRNSLPDDPAWRYAIPEAANENTVDRDYSGGISTDLLVDQIDVAHFVASKQVPLTSVASGGGSRSTDADDDREVPDTLSAIFEYPGDFRINYGCYFGNNHCTFGEQFLGNEGTIEVLDRQYLNFYPETFRGRPPEHAGAREELKMHLPRNDNYAVEDHIRNWLEAVRGDAELRAPLESGQEAAISGHMATRSYRSGQKATWDNDGRRLGLG